MKKKTTKYRIQYTGAIYEKPDFNSQVIGWVFKGEEYIPIKHTDGFVQIETNNGFYGYINHLCCTLARQR